MDRMKQLLETHVIQQLDALTHPSNPTLNTTNTKDHSAVHEDQAGVDTSHLQLEASTSVAGLPALKCETCAILPPAHCHLLEFELISMATRHLLQ